MVHKRALAALLAALVVLCACLGGECQRIGGARDGALADEPREPSELRASRHKSRILEVPYSLARFLSYNARGAGSPLGSAGGGGLSGGSGAIQSGAGETDGRQIAGYKRSRSALDALTGITLGKRSTNPLEFVNFEPVFRSQSLVRGPSRVYDLRWAPFDSIEAPSGNSYARAGYARGNK